MLAVQKRVDRSVVEEGVGCYEVGCPLSGRGRGWRFRRGLTVQWSRRGMAVQNRVDRSVVKEGFGGYEVG